MVGKKTGPYGDKLRENRGSLIKAAHCTPTQTHTDTHSNMCKIHILMCVCVCTSLAIIQLYMLKCVYGYSYTKEEVVHTLADVSATLCAHIYR